MWCNFILKKAALIPGLPLKMLVDLTHWNVKSKIENLAKISEYKVQNIKLRVLERAYNDQFAANRYSYREPVRHVRRNQWRWVVEGDI